jgi:GNAT superfamily N-acetyltransferase
VAFGLIHRSAKHGCLMRRIEPLDHHDLSVARKIQAVLLLAHAQEVRLLQGSSVEPAVRTAEDIRAGVEFYLGAFEGETLLGALGVGPDDEPGQICIALLVVHPAHQREGVASALVAEALRRGEGMTFSVTAGALNMPALALYRGAGFVEYRRGTLGPEALEIVKLRRAPNAARRVS